MRTGLESYNHLDGHDDYHDSKNEFQRLSLYLMGKHGTGYGTNNNS